MYIYKNYIRIGIRIEPRIRTRIELRIRTRIELRIRIGRIGIRRMRRIRRVYLYTYIYE